MKQLNEAYAVLGDPGARTRYDVTVSPSVTRSRWPRTGYPRASSSRRRVLPHPARIVFWIVNAAFFLLGGYLVYVEWRPILNDVLQAQTFPMQWLFATLWFGLVFLDLLYWLFNLLWPLQR